MFKFKEGAAVRLKQSIDDLGINTTMTGVVWALYSTVPNSYEVKFTGTDGQALDITLEESELVLALTRKTIGNTERPQQLARPAATAGGVVD